MLMIACLALGLPPQCPPVLVQGPPVVVIAGKPTREPKNCPCSSQCTCGCTIGADCTCGNAASPPMSRQFGEFTPTYQLYRSSPATCSPGG